MQDDDCLEIYIGRCDITVRYETTCSEPMTASTRGTPQKNRPFFLLFDFDFDALLDFSPRISSKVAPEVTGAGLACSAGLPLRPCMPTRFPVDELLMPMWLLIGRGPRELRGSGRPKAFGGSSGMGSSPRAMLERFPRRAGDMGRWRKTGGGPPGGGDGVPGPPDDGMLSAGSSPGNMGRGGCRGDNGGSSGGLASAPSMPSHCFAASQQWLRW